MVWVEFDNLDGGTETEPWLSTEAQHERRNALSLNETKATDFSSRCEFVSLGCYCGVARALQAVGLKQFAYPFDWVRTPIEGIIQCLDTCFADFMTYTICRDEGKKGKLYTGCQIHTACFRLCCELVERVETGFPPPRSLKRAL